MTLSIIDMRLKVFPQYLEYRVSRQIETVVGYTISVTVPPYKQRFYYTDYLMSFDEWLYRNNYSNLIL